MLENTTRFLLLLYYFSTVSSGRNSPSTPVSHLTTHLVIIQNKSDTLRTTVSSTPSVNAKKISTESQPVPTSVTKNAASSKESQSTRKNSSTEKVSSRGDTRTTKTSTTLSKPLPKEEKPSLRTTVIPAVNAKKISTKSQPVPTSVTKNAASSKVSQSTRKNSSTKKVSSRVTAVSYSITRSRNIPNTGATSTTRTSNTSSPQLPKEEKSSLITTVSSIPAANSKKISTKSQQEPTSVTKNSASSTESQSTRKNSSIEKVSSKVTAVSHSITKSLNIPNTSDTTTTKTLTSLSTQLPKEEKPNLQITVSSIPAINAKQTSTKSEQEPTSVIKTAASSTESQSTRKNSSSEKVSSRDDFVFSHFADLSTEATSAIILGILATVFLGWLFYPNAMLAQKKVYYEPEELPGRRYSEYFTPAINGSISSMSTDDVACPQQPKNISDEETYE